MKMKMTIKLWHIGLSSGFLACVILALAVGYVIGADHPSSPELILIAAVAQFLGILSACSFLSAVIVRVLQGDQRAAAVLREARGQLGGDTGTVRRLRQDR